MSEDLSPVEAFELVATDPRAVLIDVRTRAEWSYVGLPDLSRVGKQVVPIEWTLTSGGHNDRFVQQLEEAVPHHDAPLAFICRSGHRSRAAAAAAAAAGYSITHNVAEGFEGDVDSSGHRGTVGGWKVAGLPWRQT
jgi:rhodanese-related sulfurtransferase